MRLLVAGIRADLRITGAQSLKEKRHVVKSVIAALASRDGVGVSEIDHQDLWQRSTLGVATVASHPQRLEQLVNDVDELLHGRTDLDVLSVVVSYLDDEQ
ncbi:MAG: DUF503 domain-containing protein [Actinobacteria bacterium]|nr:DUF503 domain-containing protein [Actinomycetota bacterium]